jgi:hypothetical protein
VDGRLHRLSVHDVRPPYEDEQHEYREQYEKRDQQESARPDKTYPAQYRLLARLWRRPGRLWPVRVRVLAIGVRPRGVLWWGQLPVRDLVLSPLVREPPEKPPFVLLSVQSFLLLQPVIAGTAAGLN